MKIPTTQSNRPSVTDFLPKMSHSTYLAQRFQQKWMALHPQDTCNSGLNLDDSLTSLGWLQNLKVSEFTQPCQNSSSPNAGCNNNRSFIKQEKNITTLQTPVLEPRLQVGNTAPSFGIPRFGSFDYKTNPYVKPPYSYTSLICMAMQATRKSKITLSSIYNWIRENFVYYRLTDPSWQNSIRHNLSLNKCFEKVPRQKDEPGKGGFWRVNPEYGVLMENGIFKKRRGNWDTILSPPQKRIKMESDYNTPRVSGMKSNARDDKLLSNGYGDISINDEDENSLTLKDDLNWMSVLSHDIKQNIQDDNDNSPIMTMSPPSSEANSDDLGLGLLFQTDFSMGFPIDFHPNDPLDLTVQGTTIKPPCWWCNDSTSNIVNIGTKYNSNYNSLNTLVPPSTGNEHADSVWGESLEFVTSANNLGLDTLLDFDNMPSPKY